ncbi:response regulator [Actinoplanes auranticolor]|uniref:DNA-binding response regulator n=1 Tax=Actinoplanes auranticolor TaxID=47988 RepID=A0A919VMH6_9ACTN|nr:response regulator transcription factor [Actinoplanes auranticolor]GIM68819.1 DNA-binding response regulator [Actinoplanes auranticolor]
MIRVVVVDDQELVLRGFRSIISVQKDMVLVGEAADGAAALRLLRDVVADVVVMDIRMPVMDGIDATKELVATGNPARVLAVTTYDTDKDAFAALQAGAGGFLLKNAPPDDLLAAIRAVAGGDAIVAPRVTRRLLDRFAAQLEPAVPVVHSAAERLTTLTDREREVLLLVAQGRSNAEIGERLHVAETTVKTHVGRILAKLELRDRVQAVVLAYETGLVRPNA